MQLLSKSQAEEFSTEQFEKRVYPIDLVKEVQRILISERIVPSNNKFEATFQTQVGVKVRRTRCYWRLCRLVWWLTWNSFAYCQGTLVMTDAPVIPFDVVKDLKFNRVPLPNDCPPKLNLRHIKPDPLVKPVLEVCLQSISEEDKNGIDEFVHTSKVKDPLLRLKGSVKLGIRPPKKADRRAQFLQFVRYSVDAPEDANGKILRFDVDLSPQKQLGVGGGKQAAGFVPTIRPKMGSYGSKQINQWAAVAVNEHDRRMKHAPPAIPHQQFSKSEVIKKGKEVRTIQIQGQSNYIIDRLTSVPPNRLATGIAVGIKSTQGGYQRLMLNQFLQWELKTGGTWDEFIDFLDRHKAHESDKVGWEASTNEQDGWPYLLNEICKVKGYSTNSDKRLHARALADYANPLISLGREGFFAKFRVASGTYRTSDGNSQRHRGNNLMVCDFMDMHTRGCGDCVYCSKLTDFDSSLKEIRFDDLLLKLRRLAWILGDDYYSVSLGEGKDKVFDGFMDFLCGTETKTEVKEHFRGDRFEFLRRKLQLTEDNSIVTERDTVRTLAKLLKGQAVNNPHIFNQALMSARYEAGSNEFLQDILFKMHAMLNLPQGPTPVDDNIFQSYQQANPQVADMPVYWGFNYNDVVNSEQQFIRNLTNAICDYQLYTERRTGVEFEKE